MKRHEKDLPTVKKAMRGNPRAFEELVRQEEEYLYRMAYLYTRQEDDALDAVQEGILKAYKNIKSLRDPAYFKTWLTRIVINSATDVCRKRQPQLPLEEAGLLTEEGPLSWEDRMDLRDAIDRLPDKYRDVVQLKYFDGFTLREIAEKTGQPEGTVSSQLSRAIGLLRKDLKEESLCESN